MSQPSKPDIASSIAFCVGCGLQTHAQAKFCNSCGTPLLVAPVRPPIRSQPVTPAKRRPNVPATRRQPLAPTKSKLNSPPAAAPVHSPAHRQPLAPARSKPRSTPMIPAATERLEADTPFDLAEALVFPFRERGWGGKLCVLSLIALLPFFSIILLRGWRLEIARRIGRSRVPLVPSWSHVGSFFARGLVLWLMTGLYAIPQIILLAVIGISKLGFVLTIAQWSYQTFILRNNTTSFLSLLTDIGFSILTVFAVPAMCALLSYPFYRVGMIRYALTGRAGAFFAFGSNWYLTRRHVHSILALFFFELIVNTLFTFLTGLFLPTGIGILLVPALLLPISYWMTGHIFGTVALHMRADIFAIERRSHVRR